jgi:hypothetical protein
MSEFKTILSASKYEINKDGDVQTIDKKTPIFPYPLGSKIVKLTINNGSRQSFTTEALIQEAFSGAKISIDVDNIPEARVMGGQAGVSGQCVVAANGASSSTSSEVENKIMSLDTFTSVKMWKLHEAGIKEDRIKELVGPKNQANVSGTIKKFKKNETLRERADKIKI